MEVLILGLNYAPEPVGIGPCTASMAEALAEAGHRVRVICAKPYYPDWRPDPAYAGGGVRRGVENGVEVLRVPIYVPSRPGGINRIVHYLSFALAAFLPLLVEALRRRPAVVIAIAPSLIAALVGRLVARLTGARFWLHVQDFEVEAAFATGLLPRSGLVAWLAHRFERRALDADCVSTISPQMCAGLERRGIARSRIFELRNGADLTGIVPLDRPSSYRREWGIDRPHVAVYSGNIAGKQGLETVIEAARLLRHRRDLLFVICGSGPARAALVRAATGLDNVQFRGLQPRERLPELLGIASVHLLPQIDGVADLVLPSKLTNMLASGRPVAATAVAGTALAAEVEGCGVLSAPGDPRALATSILQVIDDTPLRMRLGGGARRRAEERWDRRRILASFERQLCELAR